MDRQVGDHRNRQLEVDQLAFNLAVTAEGYPPGQGQVAVEPRRQQRAAVNFHAQLQEALALQFRLWLDPQARAVGMGADQTDTVDQGRVSTELERDDRGVVSGQVVAAASGGGPTVALVKALETRRFKA